MITGISQVIVEVDDQEHAMEFGMGVIGFGLEPTRRRERAAAGSRSLRRRERNTAHRGSVGAGHTGLLEKRPLQGERLVLEPLRAEHAARLPALRRSPTVARWWDRAPEGWPLAAERDVDEKFAITVEGEVAGFIQFFEEPDPDARHADIDLFVGPEHQDRGLGTEAVRVLIRHLLEERRHHRITLYTSPANERAIRAYEKVGFRRFGVLSKAHLSRATGQWEDELLMEYVV